MTKVNNDKIKRTVGITIILFVNFCICVLSARPFSQAIWYGRSADNILIDNFIKIILFVLVPFVIERVLINIKLKKDVISPPRLMLPAVCGIAFFSLAILLSLFAVRVFTPGFADFIKAAHIVLIIANGVNIAFAVYSLVYRKTTVKDGLMSFALSVSSLFMLTSIQSVITEYAELETFTQKIFIIFVMSAVVTVVNVLIARFIISRKG